VEVERTVKGIKH